LRRRNQGVSLGYTLSCKGGDLKGFAQQLHDAVRNLGPAARLEDLANAMAPLAANVVVRTTHSATHLAALEAARAALRSLAVFSRVAQAVGAEHAEGVTLLLIAVAERLVPAFRDELSAVVDEAEHDERLVAELATLRAQLSALWSITTRD
ncbi:MAG: hypothetical protein ABI867_34450, partial [Kofleriaceae bacterium]